MSHHLSGRMFRFLDVGMLVLGSLLGLASPSMAQPIPGAIPGSGSSAQFCLLYPSPPTSSPGAPRRSAPGSALPSSPMGIPAPSVPGSVLSDPASSAHRRVSPLGHSRLPRRVSNHQHRLLPSQERPQQHQPHYRHGARNSRPSSAWWRGIPRTQLFANLAMICLRVCPQHSRRSPMCLWVPVTSSGQGTISISSCGGTGELPA